MKMIRRALYVLYTKYVRVGLGRLASIIRGADVLARPA